MQEEPKWPRKKIYLAGKIDKGDWRHDIVKGLRGARGEDLWAPLECAIFDRFDYMGPYFVSCDHGCYHQPNSHGMGLGAVHVPCMDDVGKTRKMVANACGDMIENSDLFFAWIDSTDCYGTLVETGQAIALWGWKGQPEVVLCHPPGFDRQGDLWFAFAAAPPHCGDNYYNVITATDPKTGLMQVIRQLGWTLESPLEEAFWHEWLINGRGDIEPQYEVFGGKYRLDFAHPATKVAIELDGFTYHGDQAHFKRDRKRDRELSAQGWTVIRFAGDEVRQNVGACVEQAANIITSKQL